MATAILACGILAGCQARFPEVSQASKVEIRLTRDACFGWCPVYAVAIAGDGTVTYDGVSSVAVSGRYQYRIAPADVAALVRMFEQADFFLLEDEYIGEVAASPFYSVSLTIDGRTKRVMDHIGEMTGRPPAVRELEDAIDRTAGTAKWIRGTPETMETLRKAGFNFSSPLAGVYLVDALEIGSYAYARELIEAGAPLDGRTTRQQQPFPQLLTGAGSLRADATARLLAEAAIARGSYQDRTNAVWLAVRLDDADLLRRLIARGADIRITSAEYPWITPLSDARSVSVARVLLAAGLDPNQMRPSPLMVTASEDVALVLAGKSMKDEIRTALIARAREKGWTRLLAKLDAAPPS